MTVIGDGIEIGWWKQIELSIQYFSSQTNETYLACKPMAESKRNRNKDKENCIYKRPQNGLYKQKASAALRSERLHDLRALLHMTRTWIRT